MVDNNMFKAFMPITKSSNGSFVGILSDTSIDRDDEFMTKELLDDWATNKSLPMLANHENKVEKFIGGWKNLKTKTVNGHTALIAEPFFFSKEASPLAAQVEKLINEAIENGLSPGISIGAIPKEVMDKKCGDGMSRKGYVRAELVEATFVPIQSNRNASFSALAKSFDLEGYGGEKTMTEENVTKETPSEEVKPEEEVKIEEPVKEEKPSEETETETPKEEPEVDGQKIVEENKSLKEELNALKKSLEVTKSELQKTKEEVVLKATYETPEADEELLKKIDSDSPLTIEKMLKLKHKLEEK